MTAYLGATFMQLLRFSTAPEGSAFSYAIHRLYTALFAKIVYMENKKRFAIIGTGALVVLGGTALLTGPSIYSSMMEKESASAPTISMSAAPQASNTETSQPALAGTWQVGKGSEAGYRVNEVLSGENVTVTGRTSDVTGTFTVNTDGNTLEQADFTVDLSTVATDSDRRDNYFKNTTIDTAKNPTAQLRITKPVDLGKAPTAGETRTVEVTGDLTLKGITQSVTFTVDVAGDGNQVQIATAVPITFADYGIEAPSLGFVSVEDHGSIEVQLVATKSSS